VQEPNTEGIKMENPKTQRETHGIDITDTINQHQTQPEDNKILSPKTGTATSSPTLTTASQSFNIANVMLWMQRNAYEDSTIRKVGKLRARTGVFRLVFAEYSDGS
jgi:hypothetical protein